MAAPKKPWIQNAIAKPGALRQSLKVKGDQPIPRAKLQKAAASSNATTAKRARLAITLKRLGRRTSS